MSEALIFASTNPQYDDRLIIELQVQYVKIPSSNMWRTCCVQKLVLTFRTIFVHNMFSPCSAKRRASDKDLPVKGSISAIFVSFFLLRKNYPNTYYFTTRKLNALKCQKLFTRRTSTLNLVFFSKKNLTL